MRKFGLALFMLLTLVPVATLAAEFPAPPSTFTLTAEQAQDYARRLQAEMAQAQAIYEANAKTLAALQQQASPKDTKPEKAK